jgi:hypothetical protein
MTVHQGKWSVILSRGQWLRRRYLQPRTFALLNHVQHVTFLPYGKFSLLTAVFGICSSRDRNESSYIKKRGYVTHTVVIGQLVFAIPAAIHLITLLRLVRVRCPRSEKCDAHSFYPRRQKSCISHCLSAASSSD